VAGLLPLGTSPVRTEEVRRIDRGDIPAVRELLSHDPMADVFVTSRFDLATASGHIDGARLGGELWGYYVGGHLDAMCFTGSSVVPVQAGPAAIDAFLGAAFQGRRRAGSIFGPVDPVLQLWQGLEPHWGPARDVRPDQPLLAIDHAPLCAPDPLVRHSRVTDIDTLFPAAVAMFTEEVGVSPLAGGGGPAYRQRLIELAMSRRSYALYGGGRVIFKAEVGCASRKACQIQGVWVAPDMRGRGIGTAGMAAVVELARNEIAPVVTLYVNGYNQPARAAYERVGFRQVGTFASILM
jgi:predicted GNAT family acetyltransferase